MNVQSIIDIAQENESYKDDISCLVRENKRLKDVKIIANQTQKCVWESSWYPHNLLLTNQTQDASRPTEHLWYQSTVKVGSLATNSHGAKYRNMVLSEIGFSSNNVLLERMWVASGTQTILKHWIPLTMYQSGYVSTTKGMIQNCRSRIHNIQIFISIKQNYSMEMYTSNLTHLCDQMHQEFLHRYYLYCHLCHQTSPSQLKELDITYPFLFLPMHCRQLSLIIKSSTISQQLYMFPSLIGSSFF